mmetsp:Transcript_16203/g.33248  ORF Transcript_16203/g.33248 Transcript_16203/m.33248 type:complete len:1176 (+) Transcript_16203:220-3747(+)
MSSSSHTVPSTTAGSKVSHLDKYRNLLSPHVDGFSYFTNEALERGLNDIGRLHFQASPPAPPGTPSTASLPYRDVQIWYTDPVWVKPTARNGRPFLPKHARELGESYNGELKLTFNVSIDGNTPISFQRRQGPFPIMLGSALCHTSKCTSPQLVKMGEEATEFGGPFIISGIERCIRLLQVPRCNVALAIRRPTYKSRGSSYSEYGVAWRGRRWNDDCSTITNTLHWLTSGSIKVRFSVRKQEFLVPAVILLRACGVSGDNEIFTRLTSQSGSDSWVLERVRLLLHDAKQHSIYTQEEAMAYVGARFRAVLGRGNERTDVECGAEVLDKFVIIDQRELADKASTMIMCMRKLYAFVGGRCGADNADSLQNLELLLPGHLIAAFVKEKIEEQMTSIRKGVNKEVRLRGKKAMKEMGEAGFWGKVCDRYGGGAAGNIGKKVAHFLSTGNIVSSSGLDLMQVSGYTIVAERLNFLRYISHYRSVHRGQFFMTMKTTAVRKLLPDSWGFLCPVHTPDGGPCGLLNHLAVKCETQTGSMPMMKRDRVLEALLELGVTAVEPGMTMPAKYLDVVLDGRVIGGASINECNDIVKEMRKLKVTGGIEKTTEVALFPPVQGGPFPGLFIGTGMCRFIRPVQHRQTGMVEYLGPMEQPFLSIACMPEDIREETTHVELDPNNLFSLIASCTPFSDYNQSPRNMYQCQMGKQTMGSPAHSLPHRTDNKLYRIQNPQAPLVQTSRHGEFKMDDYPNGTNAVVAVLSYTGFDMEDAMILNKSSYERGFGHASVYKTKIVDLKDEAERTGSKEARLRFSNQKLAPPRVKRDGTPGETVIDGSLGPDGLPHVGQWVEEGDALYSYVDELTGKEKVGRHKEMEKACVQNVRLLGADGGYTAGGKAKKEALQRLSVTLRIPRNPVIGDKFSSRHGQKGVMSILWPQADMPFSESGISPDCIINPHAFPSRMTIGMLIESMAGKAGALHGKFQDATPFSYHESKGQLAIDQFGEQLQEAGYSYYGSEPLYSGVTGQVMHADLYIGVVFYQRLRHMVSDKAQVRATGAVNQLTRQPIKGRKKGGGIRLGEMERDALLSHGSAYLLHDRLMACSDTHVAYCCRRCGGVLTPQTRRQEVLSAGGSSDQMRLKWICTSKECQGKQDEIVPIRQPYVFKYLANELAGMGIKMRCEVSA